MRYLKIYFMQTKSGKQPQSENICENYLNKITPLAIKYYKYYNISSLYFSFYLFLDK